MATKDFLAKLSGFVSHLTELDASFSVGKVPPLSIRFI